MFTNHINKIYMNKSDLALDNLQWLICHKTKPNQNPIYLIYIYKEDLALNNQQWLICHKTKPNQTKPNQQIFNEKVYLDDVSKIVLRFSNLFA